MQYIYQFQLDKLHSKVGGTGSSWDNRYKQSKTWTVVDPAVVGVWMVDDWKSAEKSVHSMLKPMKLPNRREVFNSSPEIVFGIIKSVLGEPIISGNFLMEPEVFQSLTEVQKRLLYLPESKFGWYSFLRHHIERCCPIDDIFFGELRFSEEGFDFMRSGNGVLGGRNREGGFYMPVLTDDVSALKVGITKAWKAWDRCAGDDWRIRNNVTVILYSKYIGDVPLDDLPYMLQVQGSREVAIVQIDEWFEGIDEWFEGSDERQEERYKRKRELKVASTIFESEVFGFLG